MLTQLTEFELRVKVIDLYWLHWLLLGVNEPGSFQKSVYKRQWIRSLSDMQGPSGTRGPPGPQGPKGRRVSNTAFSCYLEQRVLCCQYESDV